MNLTHVSESIRFDSKGLVPVIVQDVKSRDVLMMAWMNKEALELTIKEKVAVYWSRSRQCLWQKGEVSGHIQKIQDISVDCDADTLLLKVIQIGGISCHTGHRSCFFKSLSVSGWAETETPLKSSNDIYGLK